MSSLNSIANRPNTEAVNPTDQLENGVRGKRDLSPTEKNRAQAFVSAHKSTTESTAAFADKNARAALDGKPQVTAEEQAHAIASKGRDDIRSKSQAEKYKQAYHVMFTSDPAFLSLDINSLMLAVKNKRTCMVDNATYLRPEEKALRKFLLVNLALEDTDLSKPETRDLNAYKKNLESKHGDYISASIAAFETGKEQKLTGISLREFIKGYQTIEIQPQAEGSDILSLFRALRGSINKEDCESSMNKMREGFINILSREKSQNPTKITAPRHHLILSRINQINLLIKAQRIHKKFLACCEKAGLKDLPTLGNLMDACLRTVASPEVVAGINTLVRIASTVSGDNKPGRNIFITNFKRFILQNDVLADMYKTSTQRKQIVDGLDKNMKAAGVLAVGAQHATEETA